MFDLREHKGLIRRLVSEANQNDPNWKWSIKAINKTEARIFWSYLEYGDQKPVSYTHLTLPTNSRV